MESGVTEVTLPRASLGTLGNILSQSKVLKCGSEGLSQAAGSLRTSSVLKGA